MNFESLVDTIAGLHQQFQAEALRAVNVGLTARNWMIGECIKEYEQKGDDRAEYGARLFERLTAELSGALDRCYTERYLRLCRQLYGTYPEIRKSLISGTDVLSIRKSVISESACEPEHDAAPERTDLLTFGLPSEQILSRLSFTHLTELMKIAEPLKRAFYETEAIKGGWSVRELKRQIASLYYERSGLSKDKAELSRLAHKAAEAATPALAIRDPYVFEFLGLKPREVMSESALEEGLLDKLQDFLLELGRGFCFEARQKRILIGDEHYFVDLVFYHRVLKCHVLVELKVDAFRHEYLGQLNTYVNWFRQNEMAAGDGPPVGILLCTEKNHALLRYALAGMDNQLFVSKYELELPDEARIQAFLDAQYRELRGGDGS